MATSPLVILLLATGLSYQEPAKSPAPGWMTVTSPRAISTSTSPPGPRSRPSPSRRRRDHRAETRLRPGRRLSVHRAAVPLSPSVRGHQIRDRLAEQKKGYLQGQSKVVREGDVTVNDVAGQEFETQAPSPRANGTVTSLTRHFIKGPSYYVLTVMSAPSRPLPAEADKFLDSFGFKSPEAAKAGATPRAGAMVKGGAGAGAAGGRRTAGAGGRHPRGGPAHLHGGGRGPRRGDLAPGHAREPRTGLATARPAGSRRGGRADAGPRRGDEYQAAQAGRQIHDAPGPRRRHRPR